MAVVFISPKQRQNMFFAGITAIFLLLVLVISFLVFLSRPKAVPPELVFNKPKVDVNIKIFETEQFKNLQTFSGLQIQYTYKATTAANKSQQGTISAVSQQEALITLTNMGLTVTELKEMQIGRENPFEPYNFTTLKTTP